MERVQETEIAWMEAEDVRVNAAASALSEKSFSLCFYDFPASSFFCAGLSSGGKMGPLLSLTRLRIDANPGRF